MKKMILALCFVTLSFAKVTVIEGFSAPESIAIKNENLYVSNVGAKLEPSLKDGDGFISKLTKNGNIKELHFIKGLDSPKGLSIVKDVLFVADIDTLKGFDLNSKKEVFSLKFENLNFLNDIAVKNDEVLFLSASDNNTIYEVNIKNKSYKKIVELSTANGLFYEDDTLYAVELGSSSKTMFDGKGKLYKIDLKNQNKKILLSKFEGILDGVQKFGNKLYISDWINFKTSGVIRIYDLKTKEESVLGTKSLNGAADFVIDEKSKKLYIPQMIGGKISIIDLN